MTPIDVVAGIKEIAEAVKVKNDVPLYEKIVDFQGQVVELSQRLLELDRKSRQLEQKLETKAKIRFENPYFYEEGVEAPLCPKCYRSSEETLRMLLTHPSEDFAKGHGRVCRHCKEFYREGTSTRLKKRLM